MSQRRRLEFDTRGRPTYRYITVGNDGDDFVHAEVYDLMAREYVIAQGLAAVEDSEEVISGGMEEVDFPRLAEDYEGRGWRR